MNLTGIPLRSVRAPHAQRCHDLHCNRLCQEALILALSLSKSSDFLMRAQGIPEGLAGQYSWQLGSCHAHLYQLV